MKCPQCEQGNPTSQKFCGECGTPLNGSGSAGGPSYAELQRALTESLDQQTAAGEQLAEALEQQTATSEILRVISSSPTDIQPVLDAVAESAARLCESFDAEIFRRDGDRLLLVAHHGPIPVGGPIGEFTMPLVRETFNGRTVLDGRTFHVADLQSEAVEFPRGSELARQHGSRAQLSIPLMRNGVAIGTISLRRAEARLFTDRQVALVQTFADQAVIAIENARLFKELEAKNSELTTTLDHQTATSAILKVISSSPTDVQPVFDTIARNASRLCDGMWTIVVRYDGELIHLVANENSRVDPATHQLRFPAPVTRRSLAARPILEGTIVHITNVTRDPDVDQETMAALGVRAYLGVPMMLDGQPIGSINVSKDVAVPFTDRQIELLKTFADQAVIAVENVRLFTELQERTAQLGRSVDELTALGQVSQALSSTLDTDTVLATIVSRAIELSGADGGSVYEYDDRAEEFRLRATENFEEELVEASRAMPLRRGEGALGLIAERRAPIQIADIADPAVYQSPVRDVLLRTGYRAILAVPLLRDDRVLGALVMGRKAAGEFAPGVIQLLTTFANQSALAMQNARLFRELEQKSRELETASQHKSEFLANMSHELRTPLNAIIGFSDVLTERMFGELNEKQDEYVKDISASGTHLLSLINDILDLSKIEAGRMELELTEFDLRQAIDNALTLVRERAGRRGIALHQVIEERLGEIRGDERKVKQVLLNLLSNALKFTPEGGRIDVRAGIVDGTAEISVTDTGVGIAPEDQEAVFEEFRQVGGAEKKAEGTGLGLALSRKFIELHQGRIWVKSQVGIGSTFTFTLPVLGPGR